MQQSLMKNDGLFNSFILADSPSDTHVLCYNACDDQSKCWLIISPTNFDETARAKQGYRTEQEKLLSIHHVSDYASLKGGGGQSSQAMWQVKKAGWLTVLSLCFCLWKVKENDTHTQTHWATPCNRDLPTCHRHIIIGLQLKHYNNKDGLDVLR